MWSPDGMPFAFWTTMKDNAEIYEIHLNGTRRTSLANHSAGHETPACSPDGRTTAFARGEGGGNLNIFAMNSDGTNPRQLTGFARGKLAASPAWSPDGSKLAFSGPGGIYVMNADSTGHRQVLQHDAAYFPAWQ
jgi:TolB protein